MLIPNGHLPCTSACGQLLAICIGCACRRQVLLACPGACPCRAHGTGNYRICKRSFVAALCFSRALADHHLAVSTHRRAALCAMIWAVFVCGWMTGTGYFSDALPNVQMAWAGLCVCPFGAIASPKGVAPSRFGRLACRWNVVSIPRACTIAHRPPTGIAASGDDCRIGSKRSAALLIAATSFISESTCMWPKPAGSMKVLGDQLVLRPE